jgi:ankyrin repeat protein
VQDGFVTDPIVVEWRFLRARSTFSHRAELGSKEDAAIEHSARNAKQKFREFYELAQPESPAPAGVIRVVVQSVPRDGQRSALVMRAMDDYIQRRPPTCPDCKSKGAFCMPICGHPLCFSCKELRVKGGSGGVVVCPMCYLPLRPFDWLQIKESPSSSPGSSVGIDGGDLVECFGAPAAVVRAMTDLKLSERLDGGSSASAVRLSGSASAAGFGCQFAEGVEVDTLQRDAVVGAATSGVSLGASAGSGESLTQIDTSGSAASTALLPPHVAAAARDGDTPVVAPWLSRGRGYVNAVTPDGMSLLHISAANGRRELCEVLLRNSALLDARNSAGDTALHLAAQFNHFDVCKQLLASGADCNVQNHRGQRALHISASTRVDTLLKEAAIQHSSARCSAIEELLAAARTSNLEQMIDALDHGARMTDTDSDGNSSLHLAALRGDAEMCRFLLERGADARARNAAGATPMHVAAIHRHPSVIDLLVAGGGDKRVCDHHGRSVMSYESVDSASTPAAENADFGEAPRAAAALTDPVVIAAKHRNDVYYALKREFLDFSHEYVVVCADANVLMQCNTERTMQACLLLHKRKLPFHVFSVMRLSDTVLHMRRAAVVGRAGSSAHRRESACSPFFQATLQFSVPEFGESAAHDGSTSMRAWLVDSGATFTVVPTHAITQMGITQENAAVMTIRTAGLYGDGDLDFVLALDKLSFFWMQIGNERCPLSKAAYLADPDPPYAVGLDVLRQGKLLLSPHGGDGNNWGHFQLQVEHMDEGQGLAGAAAAAAAGRPARQCCNVM